VLFQNQYSFKSDVFAFGVMFYELLHMVTPWECEKEEELRRKIMEEEVRFGEGVSEETKELINGCLKREPEGRFSIEEVLERLGK
jgi:serine/threonine protein kinase